MNVALPLRAWIALLAVDMAAVLLVVLGLTQDSTPLLIVGGALLVLTSVAGMVIGVLARLR